MLALLALHYRKPLSQDLFSLLVITGLFMSVLLNVVVAGWCLLRRMQKKTLAVSPVIAGTIALFLLVQIIMLYK